MFNKILIANRGEIAVRIIRACREMGIKTVAVYSEIDKCSLHANLADEGVCIGPAHSSKSYLNIKSIIEAACLTGCDAIHPGFGFLSENSNFAKICEESNIKFIGPNYKTIELMGNKSNAKELMKQNGIPVIPGSHGSIKNLEVAKQVATDLGYPIMLKAANGGGGKGIRIVKKQEDLENAYNMVKNEALKSFNDDEVYIEKFIEKPRHIEMQVLADEYGNVIYLGERDCTIQRKNQKILEESPSLYITSETRTKMGEAAVKAVIASKYYNAGTIEFLVDKNNNFYFMEMNTRLQVEHPVTEMVTGVDIVKLQIKIAAREKLAIKQEDVKLKGHSIECRINAENPDKNFMPSPGCIKELHIPGGNGIRVDTAIYQGYCVPPTYDSMIAKLIVHADTRLDAIAKMKSAIGEFITYGIDTNTDFIFEILNNKKFVSGDYDTSFVEKEF